MRTSLLLLAAALVALPQSGALETAEIDQVHYVMVYGEPYQAHMSVEGRELPFVGCAFMQVRQDFDRGVVRVVGVLGNLTDIEVQLEDFQPFGATGQALAFDADVPATTTDDGERVPAVEADLAGNGLALLRIDGNLYPDPSSGENQTAGGFVVAREGVRDDETGAPLEESERDEEAHVRLRSLEGTAAGESFRFAPSLEAPDQLPDGTLVRGAHSKGYEFYNSRFGGTATIDFHTESKGLPGETVLRVAAYSPSGIEVANATVSPDATGPEDVQVSFPLLEFGVYAVVVDGFVQLAKYTVDVQLAPPAGFDVDIWWEELRHGEDAKDSFRECQKLRLGRSGGATAIVGRDDAPPLATEVVVAGVVAGVATVAVVSALLVHIVVQHKTKHGK